MEIYTVSLFGHRRVSNPEKIRIELKPLVEHLIQEKQYIQFLIGHDGEFDEIAAEVISEAIRNSRFHTALLIMVLPYVRSEFRQKEKFRQYNQIQICPDSVVMPYREAFFTRNRNMIDRSDTIICYLHSKSGGTFRAADYAVSRDRNLIYLD